MAICSQLREKRMDLRSPYGIVYGPHESLRLGLSLGVDLTPMTCTFDCVYCERGRTLVKIRNPSEFRSEVSEEDFLEALQGGLKRTGRRDLKSITFSGTGEPTLEPRLGGFIQTAKRVSSLPVKVITNASLLTRAEVRRRLLKADEVIAKMNATSNSVFWSMHEPADQNLTSGKIAEGISRLIDEKGTSVTVEVLFITGPPSGLNTNDTKEETRGIAKILREIQPGNVQIHTIRRSPARPMVKPVSRDFLLWAMREFRKELGRERVQAFF